MISAFILEKYSKVFGTPIFTVSQDFSNDSFPAFSLISNIFIKKLSVGSKERVRRGNC